MRCTSILLLVMLLACQASADLGNSFTKINISSDPGTPDGREGGETVEDAVVIEYLPFDDTGNTSDNVDDYDEVCPYTGSLSPDIVYAYTPPGDMSIIIDLCFSGYDTKVYVYENDVTPGSPYACNDDYNECLNPYRSAIWPLSITGGNTYYIVVDGYGGEMGDYDLHVDIIPMPPPPCVLECPAGGVAEGEPSLEDDYIDQYNGGCGSQPWVWQQLDFSILCGVSGWYQNSGSSSRDTDWFTCIADENGFVSASAYAEYDLYLFIITPDCNDLQILYDALCECNEPGTVEFYHPADTEFWLWTGPSEFAGPVNEFDYILTIEGIELSGTSSVDANSWGQLKTKYHK